MRALLNLGHTVGHALEAHGGYSSLLHGEAVALGLVCELQACAALGSTPATLVERVRKLLGALGLPNRPQRGDVVAAWPYVGADKKRSGETLRLPVVTGVGAARMEKIALNAFRKAVLGD